MELFIFDHFNIHPLKLGTVCGSVLFWTVWLVITTDHILFLTPNHELYSFAKSEKYF